MYNPERCILQEVAKRRGLRRSKPTAWVILVHSVLEICKAAWLKWTSPHLSHVGLLRREKGKKKGGGNGTFLFRLAPKLLPPWGKSVSSSVQIVSGWSPDYFWQAICFESTLVSSTPTSVAMQKISSSISRDTLLFLKTITYLEAEFMWATLTALPCARTSITRELLFTYIQNTCSIC